MEWMSDTRQGRREITGNMDALRERAVEASRMVRECERCNGTGKVRGQPRFLGDQRYETKTYCDCAKRLMQVLSELWSKVSDINDDRQMWTPESVMQTYKDITGAR